MADWERLLTFRCTGCGNCCRDTRVMVTDADVRRLVAATGRPWRSVVHLVPEGSITMDRRSPWWVHLRVRRYILAMRWAGRACIALGADDRCTVYAHRPVTCRAHPFSIEHSDTGALLSLTKSRVVRCPNEWDGHLSRRELVSVSRWTDRESAAYLERLREWNRQPPAKRARAAFERFFGFVDGPVPPAAVPQTRISGG